MDKIPSEIKMVIVGKISSMHRVSPITNTSSDQVTLISQTPSTDKMLVNRLFTLLYVIFCRNIDLKTAFVRT
jgi:hypothetical protein